MINQDLENIKNMQLSTLSVAALVVEQDKKQNTVRSAPHLIENVQQKEEEAETKFD